MFQESFSFTSNDWEQSASNIKNETDNTSTSFKVYPVKFYSSEDQTAEGNIPRDLN